MTLEKNRPQDPEPQTEKSRAEILREQILLDILAYYQEISGTEKFIPGETLIPASRAVGDHEEAQLATLATLRFPWLTEGLYARQFESGFKEFLDTRYVRLTNSGSSANLVALSALTSPKLKELRIKPGDEVITTASCFPTTANAIVMNKAIPVFVDVDLDTLNPDVDSIESAISERTRAIVVTHALGNPCDMDAIMEISRKKGIFVIEDTCDSLGSTLNGKQTGTFGHFGTFSFFPAHTMTLGEGGAVVTKSPLLEKLARSFRDWGRDCWCDTGKDNTCGKRFEWKLGKLPYGYDHKFIYSHLGYNLKLTDIQAAIGVAQLKKLPGFINARKENFSKLKSGLSRYQELLRFIKTQPDSDPAWYGFPITVRKNPFFTKNDLVKHLEQKKVLTRTASLGNITRQPYFSEIPYRLAENLTNSDNILENTFWIGVYPGLTEEMLTYMIAVFNDFFKNL